MNNNIDQLWEEELWPFMEELAKTIIIDLVPPRRSARQVHGNNVEGSASDYFRISVAKPVLAHVLADLRDRFGKEQLLIAKLIYLSPKKMRLESIDTVIRNLEEFVNNFSIFFPDKGKMLFTELHVLQNDLKVRINQP